MVDPSKGRKVLIKLDKMTKGGRRPQRALPHLPVYSMPAEGAVVGTVAAPPVKPPPPVAAPPPQPPPPVAAPPATHHKKKDPFERVDDTPKKTPDVLNPY